MRRRVLLATAVLWPIGCKKAPPLPIHQTVPAFTLTDSRGQTFSSRQLAGKPWIASFFFTSCNGPCPRLNTALSALQQKTYRFPGLRLVSFTLDPPRDT